MKSYFRPLYGIICLISAILFPYWATYILAVVGYVLFDWYIEGVLAVLLTDVMFGVPLSRFHHTLLMGTLAHAVFFAVIEIGKRFTRYGSS